MVTISIGFWNIAGLRDKLENDVVRNWMYNHDVIVLSEIKTRGTPSLPGYTAIPNSRSNHGGVAVLVKSWIYAKISMINVEDEGIIVFELSNMPGIRFCGMYNEPSDSLYFRPSTLASISAHVNSGKNCIVVGDLNARFGNSNNDLIKNHPSLSYTNVDSGTNSNGRELIRICRENDLLPVNNLSTTERTWKSSLTYRQRQNWISEVDLCLVPRKIVDAITKFYVNQDLNMPSDHAPVTVAFDFSRCFSSIDIELIERSRLLGEYPMENHTLCKRPIPYHQIDKTKFAMRMQEMQPPTPNYDDITDSLRTLTNTLYEVSEECKQKEECFYATSDKQRLRWKRILEVKDAKSLWKGINWNGEFQEVKEKERPPENAFQEHMERLLNPGDNETLQYPESNQVSIPLLDDPIVYGELSNVVKKQMKPDAGCGPDGTSPGTLNLLPESWLLFLLMILNTLFISGSYPVAWTLSKLIMLFKKGLAMDCGNYRGISVIDCIAKCYDYILNNRLMKWYIPCREQAGAQERRGCIEHIVALCLVIDRCVRKKCPLFIVFVDFSKAYDRVPRSYLLRLLKALGCGMVMLTALTSLFMVTQFILGSTIITAVLGVKQGSPTSCFMFILFVDEFIRLVKKHTDADGFLDWLHLLMLMDDTVIFATSRERLCQKLDILVKWCDASGMVLNEDKTKFMAFNSSEEDKSPIILHLKHGRVIVEHCTEYKYLGAIITSDGKATSRISEHTTSKQKDMNKLTIFLQKNKNAPYTVKKVVVDACFTTSLLYGCESWLGVKLNATLKAMYMKAVKMLLGVRQSTTNDACLIEAGYPSLEALVRNRQKRFLEKMMEDRRELNDDPLMFSLKITAQDNPHTNKYIKELLDEPVDMIERDLSKIKARISASKRIKAVTYCVHNPDLSIHPVYTADTASIVDDDLRTAFTRLRLSSHRLKIETGRWARIDPENRLCQCGEDVQTEKHVLCDCTLTDGIRQAYGGENIDFNEFMTTPKSKQQLAMVKKILDFYEEL